MPSLPRIDLVGQRCGRLIVLSEVSLEIRKDRAQRTFLCRCDCGKECVVCHGNLRNGMTKSCGCLRREMVTHHGHAADEKQSAEYRTWHGIKDRCSRPKNRNYHRYGGRGITMCDKWKNSFENFLADMGERPSDQHSIERKDNDGNYEPDNCIWATREDQDNNRSDCVFIEFDGLRMTLSQWGRHLNISRGTINARRRNGWTDEQIIKGISPRGRKLPPQGMKKPRKSK